LNAHLSIDFRQCYAQTIATINSGILVFLESDIINYEANKKELLDADYQVLAYLYKMDF
jgi:hypothetical protein